MCMHASLLTETMRSNGTFFNGIGEIKSDGSCGKKNRKHCTPVMTVYAVLSIARRGKETKEKKN